MTKTITLKIINVLQNNGKEELIAVTPTQWAGKLRSKGYKKSILTKKELASLTIKIKTK